MRKGRKKKLLPVDTPDANTLKAIRNRLAKDVEIMQKTPGSTIENRLYPLEECVKGVEWLTWLENEKRNQERRLALAEQKEEEVIEG